MQAYIKENADSNPTTRQMIMRIIEETQINRYALSFWADYLPTPEKKVIN